MTVMENVFHDALNVSNMTLKTFQEAIFYLLTLNCMSFMLCKPPFSLSSLISSTLQIMRASAKSYKDIMICFHPQLFVAPYMYLFSKSDEGWMPSCTKINRVCKFHSNSCLDQHPHDHVESENLETNGYKNDDGFRNLLNEKERRLIERAKKDVKVLLKRNGKKNFHHKILKDEDDRPDSSRSTKEEIHARESLQKSRDWSMKKKFQDEKLAIQKAKDEIIRKKYESQKLCRNQIRLLGKKFLEKSLQQGMEIQHQLAIADRILRSAQNGELPLPTYANSIQSQKIELFSSMSQ